MIRERLAELLPRWLAILLGIRRVAPQPGREPWQSVYVEPVDTGGGFRAAWRQQDPAKDPREPNGGESSSTGNDHGWSNCTMTSGALALAYQQPRGSLAPWGGDLRHRQGDLSGGTDLYDLRDAWESYGESLSIKSGQGWDAVQDAHAAGRAIVIQGIGNVPGSESFDGGHACCIAPETHSDGRWLFGDPLASGWQWVSESSIRSWAERWQSSIAFAAGEKPPAPEPPEPEPPEPEPEPPLDYHVVNGQILGLVQLAVAVDDDADVATWIEWLGAGEPELTDVWGSGVWGPIPPSWSVLDADCPPPIGGQGGHWARGPLPAPVSLAYLALTAPAAWDGRGGWSAGLWR